MGGRHAARAGALAGPSAWARVGPDARWMVLGISPRRRRISVYLSPLQRHARSRLARHVLGVHRPRSVHAVDSRPCARESRLARASTTSEGEWRSGFRTQALARTNLPARPAHHNDSDHIGHRIVHVHLLLAEF